MHYLKSNEANARISELAKTAANSSENSTSMARRLLSLAARNRASIARALTAGACAVTRRHRHRGESYGGGSMLISAGEQFARMALHRRLYRWEAMKMYGAGVFIC